LSRGASWEGSVVRKGRGWGREGKEEEEEEEEERQKRQK